MISICIPVYNFNVIDLVKGLSIQSELLAHERECLVRAEAVQRQLDSLFGRIRRVEALIMGSTVTLLLALVTILWKVF